MASERGARSEALRAARLAPPLLFKHDADLPISARREDIIEALRREQVLIVAGDTGSGKSTQLPQYCLELGRGVDALIAHTQPRRLAARALAARVAEELGQPVGRSVGFRVRFADQVSDATRLTLMTDGLLLAELATDPQLRRYDTIIVDEAHERSLNVDLLLGVLRRLLPRRPDLKVIVTSATLDVERISHFFGGAAVIAVGGRGHPIEVRYRESPENTEDPDLPTAVLEACREITAEPKAIGGGDILVFLPGEREIRDVGELLQREFKSGVDVLELYSRLSWEQQSKIFQRGSRQRIVLATNVAETSITVPGIRSVVDSGLARISRYSPRNRLQRLPIESISRASAEQRKGRCGRLGPGLCLRLYTEADFDAREPFTEPEILRTNLAALLLRLAADGLGDAESFPFLDPPDARALGDGYRLLQELEALDAERRITRRGRVMARLPLDPRLARALLESKRFRAEGELLAIVAGLSVPDARIAAPGAAPGNSPTRNQAEDPAPGAAFEDSKSEFSALVKLWRAYRKAREGPRRELRRWCKERQLSLLRLSEWDDVYAQVVERAAEAGIVAQRQAASYTGVHRSLLAGFSTMVGTRGEDGMYLGTRSIRFHIFPGSPLARRRPRWVMAANIVETSRVFARRVAEIEPQWIEAAASHLLKREYLEPDWDDEREEVVARERVSFLGLILSANRVVNYGPIAPEESRRIFAREALVYQRLKRRPDWLLANDAAVRDAQRMEERLRTRNLLQSPEAFVEFYDRALPRQVSSAATLEYFTRHLSQPEQRALTLDAQHIFASEPDAEALAQFPERATVDSLLVPVEYRFAPGEARDGAILQIPLLALPGLTRAAVDAAVPGLAAPRIEALLRSLPKDARRNLIPIADAAAQFLADTAATGGAATESAAADVASLKRWLKERRGIAPALLRFDLGAVPAHLMPQLAVAADGREIAQGRTLAELRRASAPAARAELERRARADHGLAGPWRRFEIGALPDRLALSLEQGVVWIFPTLQRTDRGLEVRFEWSAAEAQRHWRQAAPQLARAMLAGQARDLGKSLSGNAPLLLAASPYVTSTALIEALLQLAFRRACFDDAEAPRTRAAYDEAVEQGRARLHDSLDEIVAAALRWLADAREVRRALEAAGTAHASDAVEESNDHLRRLMSAEALESTAPEWLRQLPRYLKAEQRRWQRSGSRGNESPNILQELSAWSARYLSLEKQVGAELRWIPQLDELKHWIEEYRVSLYAQELKTLGPVSAARLETRAAEIEAWIAR